ncbi:serine protease [uncultured Mucilaginibacter sp.]|uniref:S1C family serine protease n=1 Tax=uncultured Mucilaginibacter sp. TaxID=797541 RepID=UPI0025F5BE3E|nr:serine protease [uncultured Mucilaginibacter sp.]
MSDLQLTELIERYLAGDLSNEEKERFEALRKENAAVDSRITEHARFTGLIKQYGERVELEKRLNAIHQEIDVDTLVQELTVHPTLIVRLWRNHHSKISVAASIAVFAILSTLYFTGRFNKTTASNYTALSRKIESVRRTAENAQRTNQALLNSLKPGHRVTNPGTTGGSGFALTQSGYIVTAFHVVNNADSLYVQNALGESYHAKLIYTEPTRDIAIIKIDDKEFTGLDKLPYNFKRTKLDVGEEVITLGFPRDDPYYAKGYISSATGLEGDTAAYQVSLPVYAGISGGPLLDTKGNVIGIISGKQTRTESAAFAVKSSYIFKAAQNVSTDSTQNVIALKPNKAAKSALAGLSRTQQIKKLESYVFMVKVYN